MLFPASHRAGRSPRVVITGAGIITALGNGWEANAEGFRLGRAAMKPVTLFDVTRQRVKTAAEVELPAELPPHNLTKSQARRVDRASRLLLQAAHEALSGTSWRDAEGVPLMLGTTSGGMTLGQDYYRHAILQPPTDRGQLTRVVQYQAQRQALDVVDAFGVSGPITLIANACASSANAIGHAFDYVRRGLAKRVLAGGYEALSQLVFAGFDSLQALSPTVCRPFDAARDGLAIGEGAAVLALETAEDAEQRGATILGEIAGYGAASDSHHLTQPHPAGTAALLAMRSACLSAGILPGQVGYVNAHGTGTPLNDSAEAAAINEWSGERRKTLPVSSTKSCVGHLLGAAGAIEAVVCLMGLRGRWLPPTTTIDTPEPACEFTLVRQPTAADFQYALTNSFGFGGANASLVLRRWE